MRTRTDRLDAAFSELGRIQRAPGGAPDLVQFRALATAHQYLPLYGAVERHLDRGDRLLDWGCGNGHVSWTLTMLGWESVTGFGFEPFPLLERMPEPFEFVQGDPDEPVSLPFPDRSFDGVLSVGVLEHVRETGGTEKDSLEEIRRVLRPGGRFVCAHFPNRGSWIERLARRVPGKHHHECLYDEDDIRRLAGDADLEVLELRSHGILPRNTWANAPAPMRASRAVARVWDGLDGTLSRLFPPFVQNHLWVAERRLEGDGDGPDSRATPLETE